LLLFLDDDVTFDPTLLATVMFLAIEYPQASVFGGPNLTPTGSSTFQHVQGAILGSLLVTGPVRRRYGQHPACFADERFFTLCNMVVRKRDMVDFEPSLRCAEENVVLSELAERDVGMRYDPDLVVFHHRRASFGGFARQIKKYGLGRGQAIATNLRTLQPVHVLPVLLVLWLISLPVLAIVWTPWWLLTGALYLFAALVAGVIVAASMERVRWALRIESFMIGFALTVTVHFCYGIGILHGLVSRRQAPLSEWSDIPVAPQTQVSEPLPQKVSEPLPRLIL
jgi:hypothetical protein